MATFLSADSQIWVAASGDGNGIVHVDENGGTAGNSVLLYSGSADNPATANLAEGLYHPTDIVLDTVHDKYFVADSDANGHNRILEGSLSQALANPGAAPALTVLYSNADTAITGIKVDSASSTVYFTSGTQLAKVGYDAANQSATVLADLGPDNFANGLALDAEHHQAFIVSTASSTDIVEVPEGTPGAQFDPDSGVWFAFQTTVTNNEIWKVGGLDATDASTADTTVTKLTFQQSDADLGANDFDHAHGLLSGIDIDPTTQTLYFTAVQLNDGANGETGGVYSYALNGNGAGATATLYSEGNATDYAFTNIAVDPASGKYYVSNQQFGDDGSDSSSVFVHGLSAGTPTLFTSVNNAGGLAPTGLDADSRPTLTATSSNATYTEQQSSVHLVNAGSAATGDADSGGLMAAAKVAIATGFLQGVDSLTINGATSGTVAGTSISFSYDASTGVMTLTGADTVAHYQSALEAVTFQATGDNPDNYGTDTSRGVTFTVSDGLLGSAAQSFTVQVSGVNDAPVLSGVAASASYTENAAAVTLSPGTAISDVDSQSLHGAAVTIGSGFVAGDSLSANVAGTDILAIYDAGSHTLTLSGTDTAAHYQQVLDSVAFSSSSDDPTNGGASAARVITWQVDDGSGANNLSTVASTTLSVTAVNDAPVNTVPGGPLSVDEDTNLAITGLSVSDADAGSSAITVMLAVQHGTLHVLDNVAGGVGASGIAGNDSGSVTLTGSQAAIDATLAATNGVVYKGLQDYSGPDTLTMTSNDQGHTGTGGALQDQDTASITVNNVNDAPVLSGVAASASYTENAAAATLSPGTAVSDVDSQNLHGATVKVAGGFVAGDTLSANVSGTSISADYNAGTHTLTLSGADSAAHYQQVLDSVAFSSSSDDPTSGGTSVARTITWQVDDGSSVNNLSNVASTTLSVTAVNDAPVNTVPNGPLTVNEDTNLAVAGLSVSDADAGSAAITVTLAVQHGTLHVLNNVAGGVDASGIAGNDTGSVTLTGSQAAIDATLAAMNGVVYKGLHDYNGPDTLTMTSNDQGHTGTGGALQDQDTVSITVVAVDDAPIAVDDLASVRKHLTVTGNVLTNDSDVEHDALFVFAVNGSTANVDHSVSGSYGTLTLHADGNFSYTADHANGLGANAMVHDVFTYTASDGHGGQADAHLDVTVTGPLVPHSWIVHA